MSDLRPIEQRPAHMRAYTAEQIVERSLKRVREQIDAHFARATLARLGNTDTPHTGGDGDER